MSDYTPPSEAVKSVWCEYLHHQSYGMKDPERAAAEFDRFINKVKADAIREARDELGVDISDNWSEWWDGYRQGQRRQFAVLNDLADRIEGEA